VITKVLPLVSFQKVFKVFFKIFYLKLRRTREHSMFTPVLADTVVLG